MAEILVIEDDRAIQNLLRIALTQENHRVTAVSTAREGIDCIVRDVVDLVILDLGLPDMNGINVVASVREFNPKLPIIVVSARGDEQEKIRCFDAGVNDYVQKPFYSDELMARVRATLRYSSLSQSPSGSVFRNGNLTIDYSAHTVLLDGSEIHLTNYEYKLLCVLAQNVGKTLTHSYLISRVWGDGGNDSNGLRVFMASLRRKLEKSLCEPRLIRTEVGVGYRMNRLDS